MCWRGTLRCDDSGEDVGDAVVRMCDEEREDGGDGIGRQLCPFVVVWEGEK